MPQSFENATNQGHYVTQKLLIKHHLTNHSCYCYQYLHHHHRQQLAASRVWRVHTRVMCRQCKFSVTEAHSQFLAIIIQYLLSGFCLIIPQIWLNYPKLFMFTQIILASGSPKNYYVFLYSRKTSHPLGNSLSDSISVEISVGFPKIIVWWLFQVLSYHWVITKTILSKVS